MSKDSINSIIDEIDEEDDFSFDVDALLSSVKDEDSSISLSPSNTKVNDSIEDAIARAKVQIQKQPDTKSSQTTVTVARLPTSQVAPTTKPSTSKNAVAQPATNVTNITKKQVIVDRMTVSDQGNSANNIAIGTSNKPRSKEETLLAIQAAKDKLARAKALQEKQKQSIVAVPSKVTAPVKAVTQSAVQATAEINEQNDSEEEYSEYSEYSEYEDRDKESHESQVQESDTADIVYRNAEQAEHKDNLDSTLKAAEDSAILEALRDKLRIFDCPACGVSGITFSFAADFRCDNCYTVSQLAAAENRTEAFEIIRNQSKIISKLNARLTELEARYTEVVDKTDRIRNAMSSITTIDAKTTTLRRKRNYR
jgi:hypothetical protein